MNTVVILAAGNGSRFGGPKQFTRFGPLALTLMQYNLCHAVQAGFTKAIIIIQKAHQAFIDPIVMQLRDHLDVVICYQENTNLPENCILPKLYDKPLGTAHALWCAAEHINGNFVIINADDYYGKSAFYLAQQAKGQAALVAFKLLNTLSSNGGVNRGICAISAKQQLESVEEVLNITNDNNRIAGVRADSHKTLNLAADALVSMNFWLLPQSILTEVTATISSALSREKTTVNEVFLPNVIQSAIKSKQINVEVLTSLDKWFGVTYALDTSLVDQCLYALTTDNQFTNIQGKMH